MAKKKKTAKRRSSSRRRRVGAIGKDVVNELLFTAVGAVAGSMVTKLVGNLNITSNPKTNEQINSALPLVGGILLVTTVGKKDKMMKNIGVGMTAAGAVQTARSLGVIGYIDNFIAGVPGTSRMLMNGQRPLITQAIAGTPAKMKKMVG